MTSLSPLVGRMLHCADQSPFVNSYLTLRYYFTVPSTETSVNFYHFRVLLHPEHSTVNMECCGNLKCYFLKVITHGDIPLEKMMVNHVVNKFLPFKGTRWFITAFTGPRNWFLSWTNLIQSTSSHPTCLRFVLVYYLPSGLFILGFPAKILHSFLISPHAW